MSCNCTKKKLLPPACLDIQKKWVLAGFIIIAVFYIATVAAQWWPTPDSSLYLGLGRSMAAGDGYTFNGEISNTVTPGLPAILAGIITIFGENYWVLNCFSALCALLAVGLAYMVIRNMTNDRRLAFAVMLCTAFSYYYYRTSRMVLTDTIFCLIFWAMMWCVLKFRNKSWLWLVWLLVLLAAALTIRLPGLLVMLPLAAGLLICWPGRAGEKSAGLRRWTVSVAIVIISFGMAGMFYVIAQKVNAHPPAYGNAIEGEGVTGMTTSFAGKFLEGMCELPPAVSDMTIGQGSLIFGLVLLVLTITGCVVAWRKSWGFLVVTWWLTVCAFALVMGVVGVRARYLLALMPVLFLFEMWGLLWWCDIVAMRIKKPALDAKKAAVAVSIFVAVIIATSLPRDYKAGINYLAKSYTSEYYKYLHKGEFDDLMKVSAMLGRTDINSSIYAADVSRLHYLSGRVVKLLPEHNIETPQEAATTMKFIEAPETQGYIVIELKEPLAGEVTKKLDADAKYQPVFTGKYLKVYKK